MIADLGSVAIQRDGKKQKELLEQAGRYTVSLYQYQLESLEKQDGLKAYLDGAVLALNLQFYEKETGLILEPGDFEFQEV